MKRERRLRFQDWSISLKVISVSALSVGSLAAILAFYILPTVEQNIFNERSLALRKLADVAYNLIAEYDVRVQKGELTLNEAQQQATSRLQYIRYDEKEYFWINDMSPRMIMHPYKPELNGKDLSSNKDPNGKHLFVEMVSVCREKGAGFVEYMWPKPGHDEPVPKVSYVRLYKPWGWIVGTGLYVDDVVAQVDHLRNAALLSLGVGLLVAFGIGISMGRLLASPLRSIVSQMDNADLNTTIGLDRKDEIGDLSRSFDRFTATLRNALTHVAEASTAVASASSEISSSAEQMAAGAQEQTSQAGEVASAVEEMSKSILENSRNAANTAATAKNVFAAVEVCQNVVDDTVKEMQRIAAVNQQSSTTVKALGESSNQIGDIISVIEDIADQTNLLALNAAIEAARAGDQGRGFAVVADEVRRLAERTTKATKEIAGMIKQIQSNTASVVHLMEEETSKVNDGLVLEERAGESLKEIVGMMHHLSDMVTQIATASDQQSSTSEQISKNVEAISSVTAETAQATQQISHTAEDLNQLTENLMHLLETFKLSEGVGSRSDGMEITNSAPQKSRGGTFQAKRVSSNDKAVYF